MKYLSKYYDGKYELIEKGKLLLLPQRYNVILNELSKLRRGRLLDIGCGEGVLLENARRQGFDVSGIDCSEYAVEICHRKNLNVVCLDIEEQEFPFNEEFDIVITADTIEHLYDHYKFLALVNNCLKEKGLLFLTTANSSWLFYRVYYLLGKTPTEIQNPLHLRFFSLSHLLRICRDQGFNLEKNLSRAYFPVILRNRFFKVPPFLSSLLSADFILVLRKDARPKYNDLTPITERKRRLWLEREGKI